MPPSARFMVKYGITYHFPHVRYLMPDLLASILAKAALMVAEALLARLIHALITTFLRTPGVRLA